MRKDLLVYAGIVLFVYGYTFIISRLQGEAKFLSSYNVPSEALCAEAETEEYKSQFLVKMLDKEFLVKVDEINWISSASNYVLLNCDTKSYPMRQTLTSLSDQLDPKKFMRVHRTAIVNLTKVASLKDRGELQVELASGEVIPVSKTYMAGLKQALSNNTSFITDSVFSKEKMPY